MTYVTTNSPTAIQTTTGNITIQPVITGPYVTYTGGGGGGSYTTVSPGGLYNASNTSKAFNVQGNAVFSGDIDANDVKLDGVSMKEVLNKIQSRLAILVPDPTKLEKYAALQECYQQYLFLEKLIGDDNLSGDTE